MFLRSICIPVYADCPCISNLREYVCVSMGKRDLVCLLCVDRRTFINIHMFIGVHKNAQTDRIGSKAAEIEIVDKFYLLEQEVLYITIYVHIMNIELVSGLGIDDLWSTIFSVSSLGSCAGAARLDAKSKLTVSPLSTV